MTARPEVPAAAASRARAAARRAGVVAGLLYVVLAGVLWCHLWAHPGHRLASRSNDVALDVWWLAWVPHALGAATNPLLARSMFWPHGVNALANGSFLLVGLVLAPLTVLFGPLVSLAVAVTLAPALDALLAYVALSRFVRWRVAAFAGGLLYGFGPFVATDLRFGHLNLTVLAFPPLLLLVLARVACHPPRRPWRVALGLAALAIGQFFVSTEILALGAIVAAVVLVVVAFVPAARRAGRVPATAAVVAVAGVCSAGALAYPTWWYLRGPRHFSGAVWGDMARFSATLESLVVPHGQLAGVAFVSGGNGDYLGVPLLVLLVAGLVAWPHDRALQLGLGLAAVAAVLSLGPSLHVGHRDTGVALPAWPLLHLPLLSSVSPSRFAALTDLGGALGLAVVLDRLHTLLADPARGGLRPARRSRPPRSGAIVAAVFPAVLAAAALAPPALAMAWPYWAQPVVARPAVVTALAELPAGTVVREFPLATAADSVALVWQAESDFRYSLLDGYAIVPGPEGRAAVQERADTMGVIFAGLTLDRLAAPFAPSLVSTVRAHAWDAGAQAVLVVRGVHRADTAAALLQAALGPPVHRDPSGWLWRRPASASAVSGGGDGPCCGARAGGG